MTRMAVAGAAGGPLFSPSTVLTLGYIALWYTFSIGLTFYNKWLFKVSRWMLRFGSVGGRTRETERARKEEAAKGR